MGGEAGRDTGGKCRSERACLGGVAGVHARAEGLDEALEDLSSLRRNTTRGTPPAAGSFR